MKQIADIVINIAKKGGLPIYSYSLPPEFSFVTVGYRVVVPLGARREEGFVVALRQDDNKRDYRAICEVVDEEPWFNDTSLALARWMAEYYVCAPAESMRLFMPGHSSTRIVLAISLNADVCVNWQTAADDNSRLIAAYLARHKRVTLHKLEQAFPQLPVKSLTTRLLKAGLLRKDYISRRRFTTPSEKIISLRVPLTADLLDSYRRRPAQLKLLRLLEERGELPLAEAKELKISPAVIRQLTADGVAAVTERAINAPGVHPSAKPDDSEHIAYTPEQTSAIEALRSALTGSAYSRFLLHGVTGSGKTQVYVAAVKAARALGKTASVLVPEIGVTDQIVTTFKTAFGDDVIVLHSRLTVNERMDSIMRLRQRRANIVIGTRSALFVPIDELGLIIVDEEHDASYKQEESPYYHVREVAAKLAWLHQGVLLLGSATPSLESYYMALNGRCTLLPLLSRFGDTPLPAVEIVDMRAEFQQGRRGVISRQLRSLIAATLNNREQIIVVLNRRGFATFVLCRECGHVMTCADCSLPLVYHSNKKLQCHYCDTSYNVPDVCPKCGSRYIKFFGTGTERLELELAKLFPSARIIRMDRDTTGAKSSHSRIINDFKQAKYDILLGTQMVTKGHDIENVTAVGVISADSSLNIPDFRSAERCFAMITQAAGRAGRRQQCGRVVVQTYNPEHYAVQTAAVQDYAQFYRQEIIWRKQLFYPPYCALIKFTLRSATLPEAMAEAEAAAGLFTAAFSEKTLQLAGPVAAAVQRRDSADVNFFIKTVFPAKIKQFISENELNQRPNMIIDVNPLKML